MRVKVEFRTNIPELMKLDFNEGVLKPSAKGYGDEYQYVIDDDARIMWVKPDLHALIQKTGAGAGDEIAITRREVKINGSARKSVQWEVQRVMDEPAAAYDPRQYVSQPAPIQPAPTATAQTATMQTAPTVRIAAAPAEAAQQGHPQGITDPATEGTLTRALCTALAAARASELYAAKLGMAVRFSSEDVRALAITTYISITKGAR